MLRFQLVHMARSGLLSLSLSLSLSLLSPDQSLRLGLASPEKAVKARQKDIFSRVPNFANICQGG